MDRQSTEVYLITVGVQWLPPQWLPVSEVNSKTSAWLTDVCILSPLSSIPFPDTFTTLVVHSFIDIHS